MRMRLLVSVVVALVLAPGALDASSFDFSIVPGRVAIHLVKAVQTEATPGNVYVDASLLDAGRFAWGVVQHEYAHQVDFLVLSDDARAKLQAALGATAWCTGAPHGALGCERFADLVSWAYWQSPDNCLRPGSASDEGAQMTPAAFRTLLAQVLSQRTLSVHPPRNR